MGGDMSSGVVNAAQTSHSPLMRGKRMRRLLAAVGLAAVLVGGVWTNPATAGPRCNRSNHSHWSNAHNHNHNWTYQYTMTGSDGSRYEMYYTTPHGYFKSTQNCNNVAIAITTDTSDPFVEDVQL